MLKLPRTGGRRAALLKEGSVVLICLRLFFTSISERCADSEESQHIKASKVLPYVDNGLLRLRHVGDDAV